MTIEQTDVIDGLGLHPDGSAVEMWISDHLEWGDQRHLQMLVAKVEAYTNAALSGQLVEAMPQAEGKAVCIILFWEHLPDAGAKRAFEDIQQQLSSVKISFETRTLPAGY